MVNQPRPGFNTPGQFPGHAVRAAPTQLSTPLVPQRHLVAPTASVSSDMLPSLFGDSRNSRLDSTDDIFAQSAPAGVHSAAELFGQNSHAAFGRFRSGTSDLFSRQQVRCEIPTQQLSQQDDYEILFSSPKKLSKTATPLISRHPSSHGFLHSASKSAPPPTHSQSTQQYPSYIQQSPSLTFGQAPPPTAPILKFGDSHRSESIRSSTSEAQKCQEPSEAVCLATSTPSPGLSQITLEIPSSDKLVHDFLKFQVHERFARFANYPATSKLLCSDIPDTVEGLKALYVQQRWKTLTKKSLQMLQDPRKHIDVVLEIKSWWLAGLIKEGHYDNAASVLDQIGDLDELPVLGGSTSFVHIRLLLLQALLSKCQGKIVNHEKQLFHLILRLQGARQQNNWQVFENVDKEIFARWLRIAQFALANHLVHQQKFRLALRVSSQIDAHYLVGQDRVIVLSRLGRIRLQMGDLVAAEKLFKAARIHIGLLKIGSGNCSGVTAKMLAELEARLLLNDGLLLFAQNNLQEALSAFDSILYVQNVQAADVESLETDLFLEEDVICSAVNNYAICALYCCDVKAAVAALEQMIRSNPKRFLTGVVMFNLSSLYDLLYDNATSKSRKEMMKKIAYIYDLEHVDPLTYRI